MQNKIPVWVKAGVSFRDETGTRDVHSIWEVRAIVDDHVVMRRRTTQSGSGWMYVCEDDTYFEARIGVLRIVREPA